MMYILCTYTNVLVYSIEVVIENQRTEIHIHLNMYRYMIYNNIMRIIIYILTRTYIYI